MSDAEGLAAAIARFSHDDGAHATAIPHVTLYRASRPTEPLHALHQPAVCIIAQGAKQVMLGDRLYAYDPAKYLAISVDVPIVGHVTEASPEAPYLCLRFDLDAQALAAMVLDLPGEVHDACDSSLGVGAATSDILAAATRLVSLLENPRDIPVLAPLAERELLYRLLTGAQGSRLRRIARGDTKMAQVNRAIVWLRDNFKQSFRIEDLAAEARMSASALHQHFKAVTAMSPLQYQKQLRLQEARRLMLAHALDAAAAGHEVGYESPSQFSREYRRLFGAPPLRDLARLRAGEGAEAAASV